MTEREGQTNETAVAAAVAVEMDELIVAETPAAAPSSANAPLTNGAPAPEDVPTEMAAPDEAVASDPGLLAPGWPGAGDLSADGATLAYLQRDDVGELRIWLSPLDGGAPRTVETTIPLAESSDPPRWSPDGAALALAAPHPAGGRSAIYVVTVETGSAQLLVDHAADDRDPKWSPDGSMLAFVSGRDGRDAIAVAFVDGVGPSVQLTHAHPGQDDHDHCWSTDGGRIAFARRGVENDQIGDQLWTVNVATGETKQVTKRLANRRQLTWSPERALVLHIADDGEWDNVAVVNADNSAGWNVASEAGDKSDPHYTSDGQRVVYTRLKDGVVRCCERPASSSTAELVDPGDGIVRSPRFLPDKRVVYLYGSATGAPRWIVQEPKADAERTELPSIATWSTTRALVTPRHAEIEVDGRKIGGLVYRPSELAGPVPAVIYLAERPDAVRDAAFDPFAQALVAAGLTVYAASLPGTAGYGRKVTNGLKDRGGSEAEIHDLLAVREAVAKFEGIDYGRIAVVGRGYGGTLAMLLAGGRPGQAQAVAAIDPIADWDIEVDHADAALRAWLARTYGMPALARGVYALRTPATFAGVIDAPLLLVETDGAPSGRAEQMTELREDLAELGVEPEHEVAHGRTEWQLGLGVAAFLRRALSAASSPVDARIEQALEAAAV